MRNTITRTFNKNQASVLVYVDGKVTESVCLIPAGFNTVESAEKFIRKNVQLEGKLVTVAKVDKVSTLYGMEEDDFIKYAKQVDERSKETRGLITKTVNGLMGELVYMDKDHAIKTIPVMVKKSDKLDKVAREKAPNGCFGITLENIKEVSTLYAMSESDFIKYAREMVDYQHYKF